MFKAVKHSKLRVTANEIAEGRLLNSLVKRNEDFLTAAIFNRLLYLKRSLFLSLLRNSILNDYILPESMGSLNLIEFWPTWELPEDIQRKDKEYTKEPDIFLDFDNYALIIEAKLTDNEVTDLPEQCIKEIMAYDFHYGSDDTAQKPIIMMTVGGCGVGSNNKVCQQSEELFHELRRKYGIKRSVHLAPVSWSKLNRNMIRLYKVLTQENQLRKSLRLPHDEVQTINIVFDMVEIFRAYGFRDWSFLAEFARTARSYDVQESSLATFNQLSSLTKDSNQ